MYFEFFFIISDYIKTINKRIIFYEWGIPIVVAAIIYKFTFQIECLKNFISSSIGIIGVLLCFSIAAITIITTGSSKNLEEIKSKETNIKINGNKISLYRLILINFSYSVIIEVILILFSLLQPLLVCLKETYLIFYYLLIMVGTFHILLLTLRNVSDFYLIITKS